MKIILKNLLSKAGREPYRFVINALSFLVKKTRIKVVLWPRNSYVLGSLEPGYSDIDLTLCFNEKVSFKTMSHFYQAADGLRKICPIIGELNMYRGLPGNVFLQHHNFFELSRDPQLLHAVEFHRAPSCEEAAVFLLRQLEKDIVQLQSFPEKRIKKWKSHFDQIDLKIPHLELNKKFLLTPEKILFSIQYAIIHCLGITNPIVQSDVYDKLDFYLELIRCRANFYKARSLLSQNAWWICFSPMQRIISEIPPLPMDLTQTKMFVSQVRWEICGCLTQVHELTRENFKTHIDNIRKTVQKYQLQIHSEELQSLDDLFNEANRYLEV